jgi:adenine-specific DNA-methyltransferase
MNDEIKLPLTSAEVTEALLAQLREAAPQIFSEGRVDFAKLQAVLGEHIDTNPERYGLTWAGKRDAFRNVQVPSVATLRPQPDESVNWDSTENLIIEGDNLEVLKLLQKPYHGKVKMIYIDPPYNTGNEFIYPDNFREGLDEYLRYTGQLGEDGTATSTNKDTSGRYHSNWLNMMYPRLFLARNLLKEDGVIFVSIDDHEVHNLRMLMDEVFGEENFVAQVEWQKRYTRSNNTDNFTSVIDHLCIYQRSDAFNVNLLARDDTANARFTNPDNDPRGPWKATPFLNQVPPERRPNLCYPITNPFTGNVEHPTTKAWRYEKTLFEKLLNENRLYWGKEKDRKVPDIKTFLSEVREGMTPINFWSHQYAGHTDIANNEIKQLFDIKVFDTPKPTLLVKRMIEHCCDQEDIVLDFFAGSGTTAHAVLDFNQEHSTHHKFVLVQLPEPIEHEQYQNIAHITRERVRRVIAKRQEDKNGKLALEGAQDLGFRAFKLDSSNFKIWQADAAQQTAEQLAEQLSLYADNVLAERGDQDRLYELILKSGRPLSARVERIAIGQHAAFSVEENALLICLEPHLDRDTLRALFARKPQMVLCLDVAFDGNDALKTNTVLEAQSHGIMFKTV